MSERDNVSTHLNTPDVQPWLGCTNSNILKYSTKQLKVIQCHKYRCKYSRPVGLPVPGGLRMYVPLLEERIGKGGDLIERCEELTGQDESVLKSVRWGWSKSHRRV